MSAPLVTVLAVGTGLVTSGFGEARPTAADPTGVAQGMLSIADVGPHAVRSAAHDARTLGTTRSLERVPLVNHRVPKATGKLWTTADLDLRTQPSKGARTVGLLDSGTHVAVTGRRIAGYAEVLVKRVPHWVTADYLAKSKTPKAKTPEVAGLSDAPCPDGSAIESGLQSRAVKVYRAVCAAFPELTTYGGRSNHGEHVNGQAIDFMIPDSGTGQRVADFLYAHHAQLDLFDIIWSQHIWTIQRSGEGFRSMSDRGSPTANHYDHVHIKTN